MGRSVASESTSCSKRSRMVPGIGATGVEIPIGGATLGFVRLLVAKTSRLNLCVAWVTLQGFRAGFFKIVSIFGLAVVRNVRLVVTLSASVGYAGQQRLSHPSREIPDARANRSHHSDARSCHCHSRFGAGPGDAAKENRR